MVLSAGRKRRVAVLIVPDEQTWTMRGADPAAMGMEPSFDPGTAAEVLVPEQVPEPLAAGVAAHRLLVNAEAATHGADATQEHGAHEQGGHEHGGHGDMMAIVGEPSADGLVMESIELTYGPLGTPLPGGVLLNATLDGDVVAASAVRALLHADPPVTPDALSPVAWAVATAAAHGDPASTGWLGLAAVEVERAISHLAWLRSLGRLLDWQPLIEACTDAVTSLQVSREIRPYENRLSEPWLEAAVGQPDIDAGRVAVNEIVGLVTRSRALRWRLRGRGVVSAAELCGPVARASGHAADARTADVRYRALGFSPVLRRDGDALARTQVRAEEALVAIGLAASALNAPAAAQPSSRLVIEGPRGPLQTRRSDQRWHLAAPGASETRATAADAMVGLEWSAALAVLMSFDLSPWSVES